MEASVSKGVCLMVDADVDSDTDPDDRCRYNADYCKTADTSHLKSKAHAIPRGGERKRGCVQHTLGDFIKNGNGDCGNDKSMAVGVIISCLKITYRSPLKIHFPLRPAAKTTALRCARSPKHSGFASFARLAQ
jgi:hypothetical protein